GILQYQGGPVPVIDLRKRLGVAAPLKDETRIIVLDLEGGRIGMVVDAVTEVLQIGAADVTAPPPIVQGLAADYITGLVGRDQATIIVLNTGKLLASKEKLALTAALEGRA
ncbi:MAG: chemotaxis protein CheW, partial [Gemmatimonadota bacterium]